MSDAVDQSQLQNEVIRFLATQGSSTPAWVLYGALGVKDRTPAFSKEEFERFLDGLVARNLIRYAGKCYEVDRRI